MKYILYLTFLISLNTFSQIVKGKIVDSLTNKPIEYANIVLINRDYGTYSNKKGQFSIDIKEEDKKLLISSIGYKNKIFDIKKNALDTIMISLNEEIERLNEVIISAKKIKHTSIKKLGLNKRLKVRTSLPFGYEFSNLIKNPFNKRGILKTVILSLNKVKTYDYLSSYNIKFYEYNEYTKNPGDLLHFENLIITPKNKTYKLKIDVDELKIPFPENGICIGVEIVNTQYEKPIKSMAYMAPKINFTHTKEKEILTWSRYRNKNWKVRTRKSQVKKNNYINGEINLEVKIQK